VTARRRCWSTVALLLPLVAVACADDPLPDGDGGSNPADVPVVIPTPDAGDGTGTDAGDAGDAPDSGPAACTQPRTEGTGPFTGQASGYCDERGWCYAAPLPVATEVRSLQGLRPDSVWAAGSGGTILRWDGTGWTVTRHGSGTMLAVGGAADDDLWALGSEIRNLLPGEVGSGALLHWDGQAWSIVPDHMLDPLARDNVRFVGASPRAFVWGLRRDDLWASAGNLMHWDGQIWRVMDLDGGRGRVGISAVWGSAPDDVWAVGAGGVDRADPQNPPGPRYAAWSRIYHWDGRAWSLAYADPDQDDGPTGSALLAVWGSSKTDVWAVGASGRVLHWDGSEWKRQPDVPKQRHLVHLMGGGPKDLWASGTDDRSAQYLLHWDGTAWSEQAGRGGPLWVGGPGDVWTAPQRKLIERWDGCRWSSGMGGVSIGVFDFWANSASDVWAVGDNTVAHWDGTSWKEGPPAPGGFLQAVSGIAPDDLWVAGQETLAHWDGTSWRRFDPPIKVTNADGGPQEVPQKTVYRDLWSSARNDVWLTGSDSRGTFLAHWDGQRWSIVTETFGEIEPLWGSAPDDLWRTGGHFEAAGLMHHWDGTTWTRSVIPGATASCRAVTGTSRSDVSVFCDRTLFHHDGATWTPVTDVPREFDLDPGPVAAVGSRALWVLDGEGILWKWQDAAWTRGGLDTPAGRILVTTTDVWVGVSSELAIRLRARDPLP
jgi:hypothetical protein